MTDEINDEIKIVEGERIEETTSNTSIYHSRPKKEVPVPKEPFEKFCTKYKNLRQVMKTKEWKEIYSNYYNFSGYELDVSYTQESLEEIENYDLATQEEEIIKCAKSFEYFCVKYAKIIHPILGVINFTPYTYQKRVIECYGKHRFNILSKFRQGGLTTISVIWGVWRCLFKTGQRIMVVSKTDREAISAGAVAKTVLDYLPSWLKPKMDKDNEHEKQFKDTSSVLWFYTVEAARGKSITILIIDEAAFIADMHNHWKALFPVINTGGACEVISTVDGMGNWYQEMYFEAQNGDNKFNVIELDYWEHPLYNDPEWVEDTRANLGEKGWQQEIERSFQNSNNAWIDLSLIKIITTETRFKEPLRMQFPKWKNDRLEREVKWDKGALWLWREPQPGHEYTIGADCAEGAGDGFDNNVFQVIDNNTLEQVAEFYSNSVNPHTFAQVISQIGYYYNTALVIVENAQQGMAVLNTLQNQLAYEHLYYEENKNDSAGLKPSKNRRPLLLFALQQKILNGTLKINSYRLAKELNTFVVNKNNRKVEAQKGKHDDAIMAMAHALFVLEEAGKENVFGMGVPEEKMRIFQTSIYEEIKKEVINEDLLNLYFEEEEEIQASFKNILNDDVYSQYNIKRKNPILREFGW